MGKDDVSEETRNASRDLADKAVDAGIRAADSLGRAVSRVQDTSDQLMSQGAQLGDNVQKVASNFSKALDKSVAEQPMTTLGMAVAAGFILGALWKA
jgi:ElaB/YqjD/DUF883 family membrane-anchored ribosome-binding protein